MVKKKKNSNNNEDNNLEGVDLDEVSDDVVTSWHVAKDDLKRLKVESAKQGLSMGGFLRDLVSDRFKSINHVKKDVSSKLEKIIDRSKSYLFDDFDVSSFINGMFEAGIDLSDLNDDEWVDVRVKIRSGSEDFAGNLSGEDVVVKFDLISPSKSQRLDLLKIFRE